MGNSCSRCCGRIQYCCRDSCGCCPCRCCKTVAVEMKLYTVDDKIIKRKDIPYGYSRVYAGVRKSEDSYTSPILEVHTWRKEIKQLNVNKAAVSERVALGGMQTERDNANSHVGPLRGTEHRKFELEEEILYIPIESIISMKYSGEIKKELTEQTHLRINTPPPPVELSCAGKMSQWCCKTICCCCDNSNNQVHTDPGRTIVQIVGEKGERVILITIEYIRYSNIDTPSYFGALATTDAAAYYKDHLHTDILKFYLVNNQDFEQVDFDSKRIQGATLCRLVTQLKTMAGKYPDEPTLESIINKHEVQAIGDPPQENIDRLVGHGTNTINLAARVQQ